MCLRWIHDGSTQSDTRKCIVWCKQHLQPVGQIAVQSNLGDLILSRPPSFTFPRRRRTRQPKPSATHPHPLLVALTRSGRLDSLTRIQMAVKWYVSGLETTAAASGPCNPEPTAAPSLRSESTPTVPSPKNTRSDQVHRRRTCSSENSPIRRPNSTSNTPRLEPR